MNTAKYTPTCCRPTKLGSIEKVKPSNDKMARLVDSIKRIYQKYMGSLVTIRRNKL